MEVQNARVYDIINNKAGSNTAMQGISGLMGFPLNGVAETNIETFDRKISRLLDELSC